MNLFTTYYNKFFDASVSLKNSFEDTDFLDKLEFIRTAINNTIKKGGKVVLCGIGKNETICDKFVYTLNSIGVVAIKLNAMNATHGDMGVVKPNDILIILTNSGHLNDYKYLMQFCDNYRIPKILVTRNKKIIPNHTFDCILRIAGNTEMDDIFPIPNISTIFFMIVFDILCIVIKNDISLTIQQYAKYHPKGGIGMAHTTVTDLIDVKYNNAFIEVDEITDNIDKNLIKDIYCKYGFIYFINPDGEFLGAIYDDKIINFLLNNTLLTDCINTDYVYQNSSILDAKNIIKDKKYLIVLDSEKRPIINGIINRDDIILA